MVSFLKVSKRQVANKTSTFKLLSTKHDNHIVPVERFQNVTNMFIIFITNSTISQCIIEFIFGG